MILSSFNRFVYERLNLMQVVGRVKNPRGYDRIIYLTKLFKKINSRMAKSGVVIIVERFYYFWD